MTIIEYALISIDSEGAEYVNRTEHIDSDKVASWPEKTRADIRPVTRIGSHDPETQKAGEPVTIIGSNSVTIETPAIDLTQDELDAIAASASAESGAAIDAVALRRAIILQRIADGMSPANTPLPEYPS